MSKDRDWVDYTNVGCNVAQVVQLSGIKAQLHELQQATAGQNRLAAAQAEETYLARKAVERAEQRVERIATCREAVFQGEKNLRGMRHHLAAHPCAVLALAIGYKNHYEQSGLCSAAFDGFDDKEHVERLFAGLDEVIEQSSRLLTIDQRSQAQKCHQYQLQDNDLQELIRHTQYREKKNQDAAKAKPEVEKIQAQIAAVDEEWRKTGAAGHPVSLFFSVVLALAVVLCFGRAVFLFDVNAENEAGGLMILGGFLLCFLVPFLVVCDDAERKQELRDQIDALKKQLVPFKMETGCEAGDAEKALHGKFGRGSDTPSTEYRVLLRYRRAYVAAVLSEASPEASVPVEALPPPPAVNPPTGEAGITFGKEQTTPSGSQHGKTIAECATLLYGPLHDGTSFSSVAQAVQFVMDSPTQKADVEQGMEWMIENGYAFVILEIPHDMHVYSKQQQVFARGMALELAIELHGFAPSAQVLWHRSATGCSKPVKLTDVFFASNNEDEIKHLQADEQQKFN